MAHVESLMAIEERLGERRKVKKEAEERERGESCPLVQRPVII